MRRGVANLVGAHQGADFWQPVLRAEIGVGVAASVCLLFAVKRMEWRVKGGGIFHSVMLDYIAAPEDFRQRFKSVVTRHNVKFATSERARQTREFISMETGRWPYDLPREQLNLERQFLP